MKILFHLISGQNLPEYIAEQFINPDKNVFIFTDASRENLNAIKKIITGEEVIIDPYDLDKIFQKVSEKMKEYEGHDLIMNLTNGTKLMSIATYSLFNNSGYDSIYVNTEQDNIIIISKDSYKQEQISVTISPENYIKLNGQELKTKMIIEDVFKEKALNLSRTIIQNREFAKFLNDFTIKNKKYNYYNFPPYAKESNSKLRGSYIKNDKGTIKINYSLSGNSIYNDEFTGEDYFELLTGKWFEWAVFTKLDELKIFDSISMNVELDWKNKGIPHKYGKNEFDIIALKGTVPYMFECKSGDIKVEALDKIKSLQVDFLGRYSEVFLISYFPLNKKELEERFKEKKIEFFQFSQLSQLKEIIHKKHKTKLK